MKALILAGGKGARLEKKTKRIPKPMIRIDDLPVLAHQISLLKRYGIREIFLLTSYLSEVIESYFRDGRDFGVNITYFKEKKPLGTAGGMKEIEDKLKEDFLLVYGDNMFDIDLNRFLAFHKNKNSACTLLLHPSDHCYDSDLVEINSRQRVVAFHSKPHDENKYYQNLANAGLYVVSPRILKYIEKEVPADFERGIFPKILKKEALYGYKSAEYFKDMGTLDRLKAVKKDYFSGRIRRLSKANQRKAIFLDRDGVINKNVGLLHKIEDFDLLPNIAKAIKKINNSEFLAIVVTNQPVVARNLCSIEELEEIHKKMETLLGREGAKLDGIYYCPHHPDKGFPEENPKYKIKCNCRKPKIGLLKKAQKDFNIDLENSYFIGDCFRDILCGKKVGMTTIGVKTGEGWKERGVEPDYVFVDLARAVNFITGPAARIREERRKLMEVDKEYPFVSIIIPVRNEGKIIGRCLEGLKGLDYPKEKYEVIISDSNSLDDTQQVCKKYEAIYISTPKRTICAGRDEGFKMSRGEIVAFSDADCLMDKDWLKNSLKYFKDPKVGGVGGINITPDEETAFCRAIGFVFNQAIFSAGSIYGRILKKVKEVKSIPGCNAIYRKKVLDKVLPLALPLEESLVTAEDYLMNQKIRQLGYKLLYTPDTLVWHHRRLNLKKFFKQMYYYAIGRLAIARQDFKMINAVHILVGLGLPILTLVSFLLIYFKPLWLLYFILLGILFLSAYFLSAWISIKSLKAASLVPLAIIILFSAWSLGFLKELFFPLIKKSTL